MLIATAFGTNLSDKTQKYMRNFKMQKYFIKIPGMTGNELGKIRSRRMVAVGAAQDVNKQDYMSLISLRKTQTGEGGTRTIGVELQNQEIMLFARNEQFAKILPTVTTTHAPVAEQAKASAVSTTPLFDFGKATQTGERAVGQAAMFSPSGNVIASALTSPEKNSGSGDKKDGGNHFLSAHKTLNDLRLETLEKDDILGSIMGSVC